MKQKRRPYGRVTKLIAEVPGEGGGFVALLDNGLVRVGYASLCAIDSGSEAFRTLAVTVAGLSNEAIEDAISAVLGDRHSTVVRLCRPPVGVDR